MKMGIREFRERISELSAGTETVIVTHHGKRVGRYIPERREPLQNAVDLDKWAADIEQSQAEWRARTPDWRERLRSVGIDPAEVDA